MVTFVMLLLFAVHGVTVTAAVLEVYSVLEQCNVTNSGRSVCLQTVVCGFIHQSKTVNFGIKKISDLCI